MSVLARIEAHGGTVIRDRWRFQIRRGRLTDEQLATLREPRWRRALMREVWPLVDDFEERAAIREFDGGQGREEAEAAAYEEIMARC